MDHEDTETDEDLERELGWKICAAEECIGVRPSDSAHCLAHMPIDDRQQRLHAEAVADRPLDFRGIVLDQTLLDAGLDVYREVCGVKKLPGLLLDGALVKGHLLLPGYEIPQGIHARAAFFDSEIDLRGARLGGLDWIAATLKRGAVFAGAEITETADFRRVKAYSLDLSQGHFRSLDLGEFLCFTLFDMKSSSVSDALSAVDAQFHGVTMLEKARLASCNFKRAKFGTDIELPDSESDVQLPNIDNIDSGAFFLDMEFDGKTSFEDAHFGAHITVTGSQFKSERVRLF